jgi:hypothetical protein
MYGALRAPTSNCVVRPAQGSTTTGGRARDQLSDTGEFDATEEKDGAGGGQLCILGV